MDVSLVTAFALVALSLIVVPGPDWAYILTAGAGERVVVPPVLGLLLGYAGLTVVVAAGVGSLVAGSSTALLVLTVGGAVYLLHLGVRTLRAPSAAGTGPVASPDAPRPPYGPARYVLRGMGVSALNPKGVLLFVSILPQFTRPAHGWPMTAQLATLGGVFIATCGAVYLALGFASGRVLGARPGAARATSRVAGAAMVTLGVVLLAERLLALVR